MKALVVTGPNRVSVKDVVKPEPTGHELLIKVMAAGVCGTDRHIIAGDYQMSQLPLILGHEFSGIVEAVGPDVDAFEVGARVAGDPNWYCGDCSYCRVGAFNHCDRWGALGITSPGCLAEYVIVEDRFCVNLPEAVGFHEGAMIEPLACVLHSFDLGCVGDEGSLLVIGAGTIGLLGVAVGVDRGLKVSVIEVDAFRRAKATEIGAVAAVRPGESLPTGPFDYVLEASGSPQAIQSAWSFLGARGTLLQMGVAPQEAHITYNPYNLYANEWRIVGSFSVADRYREAALMTTKLGPALANLVTHRFKLSKFEEAFSAQTQSDTLKVHFLPGQ